MLHSRPQLAEHVLAVDVLQVHEPLAGEGERALVGVDVMRDCVVVEVAICSVCMASGQGCTVSWEQLQGPTSQHQPRPCSRNTAGPVAQADAAALLSTYPCLSLRCLSSG